MQKLKILAQIIDNVEKQHCCNRKCNIIAKCNNYYT